MSKKSRYLILAACIVFFVLAAPAILLYVRGLAYDPESGSFYKTGILAIKSDPKSVDVKLDGQLYQKKAGTLRFLKPKEYLVSLEKTGYQTWSKRLPVEAGRVTWANPAGRNIVLFFSSPKTINLADDVTNFLERDGKIFYTSGTQLFVTSLANPQQKSASPLPAPAGKLLSIPGGSLVAVSTQSTTTPLLLYDNNAKDFLTASHFLNKFSQPKYQNGNQLYVIEPEGLYVYNLDTGQKTLTIAGTKNFLYEGGYYYYLAAGHNGLNFYSTPDPNQPGTLLAEDLPTATDSQIFINAQKQAFVLLGQSLYKIGNKPILVSDNIKSLRTDPDKTVIALITSAEFLRLNPESSRPELLSRSLYPMSQGVILPDYGYGFVVKEQELFAEELDARDKQNEFLLYTGLGPLDFTISPDAKTAVILDGQKLKILTLR